MRVFRSDGNYTAFYTGYVLTTRFVALVIVICGCALLTHFTILAINQPKEPTINYHFEEFGGGSACDEEILTQGENCP